ncbi:P2Y purinoceptor 14-like [Carcharodon carcharias]|uniref:P2Y purinoceptor 14-like n=1 Tax=Carcharodon carcharias TaxID=13397 RepID=UPI001B7E1929|nr:P2Y purinoceptor 14-like [Carcharodon carcharias]XP_041032234.1 P2Y purinoceptor 14-like [Carcharodon carcharias]
MATSTEIYESGGRTNYTSMANNHSDSTCVYFSKGFTIFTVIAYTFICITGFILNSLAFWVYFCHMPSNNAIIVYLKNLVIADFLLVLSLPIKILEVSGLSSTPYVNRIYCNFLACIFYLNIYSSIFFLGYIGAIRYLKIVRPLQAYAFQNLKAAKLLSLGTWGVFLFLGSLFVLLINMESQPRPQNSQVCIQFGKQQIVYTITHIIGLIIFVCVLVGLGFFYFQISRQLRRSPCTQSLGKQAKAKNNILILFVVFLVCFVPYHTIRFAYVLSQTNSILECHWKMILYYAKESSLLLSSLNSCFDPVIYFLFCKAFRSKLGLGKKAKDLPLNDISVPTNASRNVLN